MLLLTRLRPDLDGGIFTYAKEGFGELVGFCSARGYWLCAVIANVSYLVIVFAALSIFTDRGGSVILGDGNTAGADRRIRPAVDRACAGVARRANRGQHQSGGHPAKLLPLGMFAVLAAIAFKMDVFTLDFKGTALGKPVWEQVKDTMLITLWVFIGVEGAVVVSARARNKKDVGRATMLAVLSALAVYLMVTLLSLGVVPRSELAEMRNPSMAVLMVELIGPWGDVLIAAGLIISVCGAYLSWTIMAAEVPLLAAQHGAFPRVFGKQNRHRAPSSSLWLTNIAVQLALVLIWLTGSNYDSLLTIASEMITVPYFGRRVSVQGGLPPPRQAPDLRRDRRLCLWPVAAVRVRADAPADVGAAVCAGAVGVHVCPPRPPGYQSAESHGKSSIFLLLVATLPAGWFMLH